VLPTLDLLALIERCPKLLLFEERDWVETMEDDVR
jgi:hypothetical protein